MAELMTIARPYAKALFQCSKDHNVNDWSAILQSLAYCTQQLEIAKMIANPGVSSFQIAELLITLIKAISFAQNKSTSKNGETDSANIVGELYRFIHILANAKRLTLASEISIQFEQLKNAANKVLDAQVRTAFPLDTLALNELLPFLENKFKSQLNLKVIIDKSLLGGICVKVGDEVYDSSIKSRLAQLKEALVI